MKREVARRGFDRQASILKDISELPAEFQSRTVMELVSRETIRAILVFPPPLAGLRQDSAKAIELAHRALEYLPEEDHFLRGLVAYSLGRAYLLRGDLPAASQKLRAAATFSLNGGDLSTASYALNALGAELETQGRSREAAACFQEVTEAIQKDGRLLRVPAASGAYVWLGRILYEWHRLDEAVEYANQGVELARPYQANRVMFIGHLVLTYVLMARNDMTGAMDSLRNAETAAHSNAMLELALRMLAAERARDNDPWNCGIAWMVSQAGRFVCSRSPATRRNGKRKVKFDQLNSLYSLESVMDSRIDEQ